MTEAVIIAIIGALGVIIAAWLTYLGVKLKSDRDRLTQLEERVGELERRNVTLWTYCQTLLSHIWNGGGPPPPDPPVAIKNLFN